MRDLRKGLLQLLLASLVGVCGSLQAGDTDRAEFIKAWQAASRGDQSALQTGITKLPSYLLTPYLEYEYLRQGRRRADAARMDGFIQQYDDWAFAGRLETVWLRTLGRQRRWAEFLNSHRPLADTEVRCHYVTARVNQRLFDGLQTEVEKLWLSPKSQHKACDPAFEWLMATHGISPELAWQRIELAMAAGQTHLSRYLERFLTTEQRSWPDRWRRLRANPARTASEARNWPDGPFSRTVIARSIEYHVRRDVVKAERLWQQLEPHHGFDNETRAQILYDLGLYAAVSGAPDAVTKIDRVPSSHLDARLLQWRLRTGLASGDWDIVISSVQAMPPDVRVDTRWRYWHARALEEGGNTEGAIAEFEALALEADYYGFLAADRMNLPYMICPLPLEADPELVRQIKARPGIQRALELRQVDLQEFARSEWLRVQRGLDRVELRGAAAVATNANWPDRSVFSLIASGDRQYYDERFPLVHTTEVETHALSQQLDAAWVFGIMRSESALDQTVISPANAHGLMQITPGTARQLTRKHNLAYKRPEQLLDGSYNIRMGTHYLRDLMTEYNDSPVITLSAYNAGPSAAKEWLRKRPAMPADVWIELIPYFETRDYVPRVLAFTAIYDWRLGKPLRRLSSRMPDIGGKPSAMSSTSQICAAGG